MTATLATLLVTPAHRAADVLPVLEPGAKEGEANVQQAWRIDFKRKKLLPLDSHGLICPLKP